MAGPIPDPNRRRRNAPTIPTTALPVTGRTGTVPKPPGWIALAKVGTAWWKWAWKTPQAAGWAPGHEALVARRASLEDDLATAGQVEGLDLDELVGAETAAEVRAIISRLAGLATGRLAIMREMRELDDRLGLSPKGMAALRWEVVGQGPAPARRTKPPDEVADRRRRRSKMLTG